MALQPWQSRARKQRPALPLSYLTVRSHSSSSRGSYDPFPPTVTTYFAHDHICNVGTHAHMTHEQPVASAVESLKQAAASGGLRQPAAAAASTVMQSKLHILPPSPHTLSTSNSLRLCLYCHLHVRQTSASATFSASTAQQDAEARRERERAAQAAARKAAEDERKRQAFFNERNRIQERIKREEAERDAERARVR